MRKFKNFLFVVCMIGVMSLAACEDFIKVDAPKNELNTETVFRSDAAAQAAIRGIYAEICNPSSSPFSGDLASVGNLNALLADESFSFLTGPFLEMAENSMTPSNGIVYNTWNSLYRLIYYANSTMEGLTRSNDVSNDVKDTIMGEAEFIRAFCYFHLVNLWGDVPLILSTDYRVSMNAPRASVSDVYEQIVKDLKEAQSKLPQDYGHSGGERVRVNRYAATAMLSRTYLHMGDWGNAETEATSIIHAVDLYGLRADINEVFLKNNTEAIWQLYPIWPSQDTHQGPLYLPSSSASSITDYPLREEWVNSLETGDQRRAHWIASKTINGVEYFYPYKYKVRYIEAGTDHTEYSVVIRLAEQYLIRAEARVRLGKLTGPNSAQEDVNVIRDRAGLSVTSANTSDELLQAIERERKAEFFTEGHRWFDLIRTGRASSVLSPIKSDWQQEDTLWPIHEIELSRNSNLRQNPGYE